MYKVFIDAGHGGTDNGATYGKWLEDNMNLAVAKILKQRLLETGKFNVDMSRESDINISLADRCLKENKSQANLFISIHHNAGKGDGYEVYHCTGSLQGSEMASLLSQEFTRLGQNKRFVGSGLYAGTQKGDYYVLKNTIAPAILGEFCFIDTNDVDIYVAELEADAYYKAICNYFKVEVKSEKDLIIDEIITLINKLKAIK